MNKAVTMLLTVSLGSWILLSVFAVLLIGLTIGALTVRDRVRRFSRALFGTEHLAEGLNRQADMLAETPKSVTGMTRLMEPQIMRDFPDFSWDQFKGKAENMLKSALLSISAADVGKLVPDASEELKQQIENRIQENNAQGVRETFLEIQIHQTEIANYRHEKGKCIIVIQSSVGYYHYKEQSGVVIEGTKERKQQCKYNMELIYIQDVSEYEFDNAVGTLCPHCGAPVVNLGNMYCDYCKSAVIPINIKVWSLHKFYEVDYNHI